MIYRVKIYLGKCHLHCVCPKDENVQKGRPVEEIIDDDDSELEGLINQTVSPQANSELCFAFPKI